MKERFDMPVRSRVLMGSLALLVLAGCASSTPAPVRQGTTPPAGGGQVATAGPGEYIVRPGDTLFAISRAHNRNVNDLVMWNNLANPHQISAGQRIRVAPPAGGSGGNVQVMPVATAGAAAPARPAATAAVRQEPKGGTQTYNDQAWNQANKPAAQPVTVASAPATLPSSPPTTPPAQGNVNSKWLWPASGRILANFNESTNKGLDIAGNLGDPVVASAAGKVVYAGAGLRGYGKLVIIKHDDEYLTAYGHNRELLVKEGDSVARGQRIAELGNTDTSSPRLHFELRKQGRPVDPMGYLPPR